jgi:carbon-monoxide dehydrogenase large subunit
MAAWMFEAAEADVVFVDGVFEIPSTNRRLTFKEVAQRSLGLGVPAELGIGLNGLGEHEGPTTFPNGCMTSEVEVDLGTGKIVVDRMICVDDVGAVVNPVTLDGQLHGSIAQGLGEVLLEEIIFDQTNGQLLTGSFLDYAMPRADVMPHIASYLELRPTPSNPLGLKGGSEAGNMGAPAAIINATVDALYGWGVDDLPLPATPERVWRALERARRLKPT